MRIFNPALLCFFIFISGCTTFNSIEVVKPEVGMRPVEVDSLQPLLEWKPIEGYVGTYDLVVFEYGEADDWSKQGMPMPIVYQKFGISSVSHNIEIPLKNNYIYSWSIKRSDQNTSDAWARYNYYFFAVIINIWKTDSFFSFRTPKLSPLAVNQD